MQLHTLGEATLTLSTLLYFIWFIPQLVLTFRRKTTNGLSIWMHSILMLGYIADLMYGFGQHLQIQYRLVTIVGLISLFIEHYQFGIYGLKTLQDKRIYGSLTMGFLLLFVIVLYNLSAKTHSKTYYDMAGLVSTICWLAFAWPQIYKSYQTKSTNGVSTKFVFLAVLTGILDVLSAYALKWPWPSKLSSPLGLIQKLILLYQCYYYKEKKLIPITKAHYS